MMLRVYEDKGRMVIEVVRPTRQPWWQRLWRRS